jgi:hypothetical protein
MIDLHSHTPYDMLRELPLHGNPIEYQTKDRRKKIEKGRQLQKELLLKPV